MSNLATQLEQPRTILQLVLIDETGDSYYRMRWPGAQLAKQAPNWRVISLDARAEERFQLGLEADLLIVYQSNDIDLLPLIEARRKLGKKTLAEYNDNFYDPPPASPVYKPWRSPLIWQSYERIMSECDGVVVTGPGLKKLFSQSISKDIHILENHLPFTPPSFEETWSPIKKKIQLAWAGSLGHIADVVSTLPTLRTLMAEQKEVHFNIMGNEALPGLLGLAQDRFSYTNWGTMAEYHQFWNPIHLGFAPLLDTPYNQCRSDIKAVEMASHAVLPILQNALPYKEFIKKTDAPSYTSLEELYELLKRYSSSPELIKESAKRCYEYVQEERVGTERRERLELYASMCTAEVSSAKWQIDPGYHEIQGKINSQLRYALVLKKAQALMDQKKPGESLAAVRAALQQNPFTPELALAELNTLRSLQSAELLPTVENYVQRFPRDWRFVLFRLVVAPPRSKKKLWNEFLDSLQAAPEAAVDFYQADIVKLFVRHLARFEDLHSVGVELLNLLSNSAELRLQMGLSFERQGDYHVAREQFSWLLAQRESLAANAKYLAQLDMSYLKTWDSALEARTRTSGIRKVKAGAKAKTKPEAEAEAEVKTEAEKVEVKAETKGRGQKKKPKAPRRKKTTASKKKKDTAKK